MTVKWGKVHAYLAMNLDFSSLDSITIDMEEYVSDILDELNDKAIRQGLAAEHIFKTRDDMSKLDKDTADLFHHIVAKLLWITKRGHPDIHNTIAFLYTWVKAPDEDD